MAELAAVPTPGAPESEQPDKAKRSRPIKTLPTERIAFPKQLDLLRAYVAASGPSGKPVTNADAANLVKMTASTVSMANAFFSDSGLLSRTDGGYLPSADVVSYQRAFEWNPETASHKLGPTVAKTWFAEALTPKIAFRAMEENEAIEALAEAAAAGPDYRLQLKVCLDYMVAAGLVQRDGTLLKLVRASATNGQPAAPERQTEVKEAMSMKGAAVATAFTTAPTEGVVQFHVSVRVDMKEFAGWQPDRIAAFFGGIAQVLAAKGTVEKEASS